MDKKSDRCISQSARFGCGYRFIKGRKRFFAWHGFWCKNDDYITISEINEDEFEEIYREYPTDINLDPVEAQQFRNKYVEGHKILKEGMNVYVRPIDFNEE